MIMRSVVPGLIALAVLAGWFALRPLGADAQDEAPVRGRAPVEKPCVGCHPGSRLDAVVSRRLGSQGRDSLDAFLAGHHVADAALRKDVIAYLETRTGAGS
jgi:hypothetical protein